MKGKGAWQVKKGTVPLVVTALFCCAAMALVDGVIRPGYAVKSAIKIALFLLLPFLLSRFDRDLRIRELFSFRRKGFGLALGLGIAVYGVILGAYFLLAPVFDFSPIAALLSENAGVDRGNFLFVSLYISFVNSLLEEFFFRGFLFLNLRRKTGRLAAYLFSAVLFAAYHAAMMIGWFSPALYVLAMAGLTAGGAIFNALNERQGTVYTSWLVHMFANFAINTVGFILL